VGYQTIGLTSRHQPLTAPPADCHGPLSTRCHNAEPPSESPSRLDTSTFSPAIRTALAEFERQNSSLRTTPTRVKGPSATRTGGPTLGYNERPAKKSELSDFPRVLFLAFRHNINRVPLRCLTPRGLIEEKKTCPVSRLILAKPSSGLPNSMRRPARTIFPPSAFLRVSTFFSCGSQLVRFKNCVTA